MASYGHNTFKGVTFGVETDGNTGVPDFPDEYLYAKRDIPYAGGFGITNIQSAGKRQIGAIDLRVMVSDDDWESFKSTAGMTPGSLVWSANLSRPTRTGVRLLTITNQRQFVQGGYWLASARFEG